MTAVDSPPRTSLEEWFTPGRFAAFLALCIVLMYPGVVFGWQSFAYRDFSAYGFPVAHYYRDSFWRGELPLWNPLSNCGIPFLAQWGTLVLYPFSLFYLLLPLAWSLSCFCLAHLVLGGMGMYFLVYVWTKDRFAACVGGLAYAFNGFSLNCLMWPHYMAVLGWLPWVILTVERAWQKGGRHILLAVAASSMQMLGGVPELILLTWLILLALWMSQWLPAKGSRWLLLRRLLMVVLLTAGLCAVQLLPFLDLLRHSQRSSGFGNQGWALPGTGWANFFVPLFHCYVNPQGVFGQEEQGMTSSYYLGIGVVALNGMAVWNVRRAKNYVLTAFMVVGLILALGNDGFLYGWLGRVFPPIGFMRYPAKFIMLVVCLAPLLAGMGMSWFNSGDEAARARAPRYLGWYGVVMSLVIGGILWFEYRYPFPYDRWSETWHNAVFRVVLLALFLVMLGLFPKLHRFRAQIIGRAFLLLLIWLDLATHTPQQNPQVSPVLYEAKLPAFEPKPVYGVGRVVVHPVANQRFAVRFLPTPADTLTAWRLGQVVNLNLPENVAKVGGFYSLYVREEEQVRGLLYRSTNLIESPLADFLNVTQISDPGTGTSWHARPQAMPLATIGQRAVFANPADTLRALADPAWNPHATVYLPPEVESKITATNRSPARVLTAQYAAHHVEIETETASASLLVIANSYYHCWRAAVDGQTIPIWRANYAFQAIQVPAGRHQVNLVYQDWYFNIGAMVSVLTLLGCAIFWRRYGP